MSAKAMTNEHDLQYLTCYDKNAKQLVGRLSYASGEVVEYKDEQAYIDAVKEELPYRPTTGMKIETLTTDPAVRKAVDDCIYDLFGEENPRLLEDYKVPNQKMEIGGI